MVEETIETRAAIERAEQDLGALQQELTDAKSSLTALKREKTRLAHEERPRVRKFLFVNAPLCRVEFNFPLVVGSEAAGADAGHGSPEGETAGTREKVAFVRRSRMHPGEAPAALAGEGRAG